MRAVANLIVQYATRLEGNNDHKGNNCAYGYGNCHTGFSYLNHLGVVIVRLAALQLSPPEATAATKFGQWL